MSAILFEILSIFWQITHLKNESFCTKIDNISKAITARANAKTATETPQIDLIMAGDIFSNFNCVPKLGWGHIVGLKGHLR